MEKVEGSKYFLNALYLHSFFKLVPCYIQTSLVRLVGILEQNMSVTVGVLSFHRVIIACRPNRSDATDVFRRRPIFMISHGRSGTALALPPFTSDAEGRHLWLKLKNVDGDF